MYKQDLGNFFQHKIFQLNDLSNCSFQAHACRSVVRQTIWLSGTISCSSCPFCGPLIRSDSDAERSNFENFWMSNLSLKYGNLEVNLDHYSNSPTRCKLNFNTYQFYIIKWTSWLIIYLYVLVCTCILVHFYTCIYLYILVCTCILVRFHTWKRQFNSYYNYGNA